MAADCEAKDAEEPVAEERGQWSGKLDFLFSCMSFAVGLGNVWRFPYMCFKNGGAVFLIPYFIMLVFVGLPTFYMEMSLGQFSGKGAVGIWDAVPLMRGIGYTMFLNSMISCTYYIVLVAWALYYLCKSFTSELPWSRCTQGAGTWATDRCFSTADHAYCQSISANYTFYDGACNNITNTTFHHINGTLTHSSPSEEYYDNEVLKLSLDEYNMDSISWKLALSLFGAWTLVFLCMIKGTKSFGKVSYVTATFPYVVLTALLIRGASLPGALKGVIFYLVPDISKLAEPLVWFDAASQIFFSLGCGLGSLATFGSYNDFKKKNKRDVFIVAIGNCLTSVYAGFAIFCILGFMAQDAGVSVSEVASDGSGLAFIAYPQAVSRMPGSQFWSFLFFIMLLMLGLGTMFGQVEMMTTIIQDNWPRLRKHNTLVLLGLIAFMFVFGLTMTTDIGVYILTIFNDYNSSAVILTSIINLMSVAYIYGANRLIGDIELMLDEKLSFYWRLTWFFTAPILTLVIFVYSLVIHKPSSYGHKSLPGWMIGIGWLLFGISIFPIPFVMFRSIKNNKKGWRALITSSDEWFPAHKEYKEEYLKKYGPKPENGEIDMKIQPDAVKDSS